MLEDFRLLIDFIIWSSLIPCFFKIGKSFLTLDLKNNEVSKKINIIDLVLLSNLEVSKSEIRRLIKGNAVKINDKIVPDEKLMIGKDFFNKDYLKLSIGKKRHIKIKLN